MRYKTNIRVAMVAFALIAALAVPGLARAIGLGEIQTDTRIGQQFAAKIPILGANASALQGLKVGLASDEAYKDAGLSEPDYLFSLKFSIEQGPQGPYVMVTSTKPVKLPFLHLLLRANWASGEVTRQYTVLLNPPTFVSGSNPQQPVSAPTTPAPEQPASQSTPPAQQPAPQPVSRPTPPVRQAQPRQQPVVTSVPSSYTVHHGDTLWGLARQLSGSAGVSTNQMMVALYQSNPRAFRGNINRLKSGYVLKVPTHSEITRIAAGEATRIVARQNSEWENARTNQAVAASGTPSTTPSSPAVSGVTGEHQPEATPVGGEQTSAPETSGRVVLTTPEVTATSSMAAAPGSAIAGTAAGAAGAAMAARSSMKAASNAATSSAVAGTGASTGGPMKVQSNAMAGLASTRQPAEAGAAKTTPQPNVNSVNSTNSVNTAGETQAQGRGLMYWVQQPVGWIVIAAVLLLLIALLLFVQRRRRTASAQSGPARGTEHDWESGDDGDGKGEANTTEAPVIESERTKAASGAAGHGDGDEDLGISTYIGGPSLDVNKVDAMDEADLHIGFGDYGKAAQILRDGIARNPQRHELRRKLLDVLFAAGDGEGFAAEAVNYRKETGGAVDWEEIAVMGRQLRPHDGLFAEGSFPTSGSAAQGSSAVPDDDMIDLDLDRLSTGTEKEADQSEFERTMDELSTFIETYVPAGGETPVSLQLPPDEADEVESAPEESKASQDEALDFKLDDDDLEPLATGTGATPRQEESLDIDGGEGDESENMVDTKLDLARAYIDMGDGDSARGVLEEVIDEGDDAQSAEARRLLDNL